MTLDTAPGEVTERGGYTTFRGGKYDSERHPNDTNKLVRADVKAAVKAGLLPTNVKRYAVTRSDGSWSSIVVSVVTEGDPDKWAVVKHSGWVDGLYEPMTWTPEAKQAGHVLYALAEQYVKHTTDIMTDYFAGGYVHVYVTDAKYGVGGGLCLPRFSEREVKES
jgi:hypothetical protein